MNLKDVSKALNLGARRVREASIKRVSTDTRNLKKGELFIAINGPYFDGHDFVRDAAKKGAIGAVVNAGAKTSYQGINCPNFTIFKVKDTLKALGDIAHYHRMGFRIPVIGVTGSAGKTTVKEIISHILSGRYAVLKNEGTKNNLIGLPFTLLSLKEIYNIAVLEMGTSSLGEIKRLSDIARPVTAVFTNIAQSHLEGLKSIDNVLKAKSEMLPFVRDAILNVDDPLLAGIKAGCRKIYYGIEKKCDFQALDIKKEGEETLFYVNKTLFRIHLLGRHNIYNALAGIAAGKIYGLKLNAISERLKTFKNPFNNRLALSESGDLKILNDTYNSNPLSFKCALDLLKEMNGSRKIVISGDMLELGRGSASFHKEIGAYIALTGINKLITLGKMSKHIGQGAIKNGVSKEDVAHYNDAGNLMKDLPHILKPTDIVLIKGSRATKMEDIVGFLKSNTVKKV